MALRRAANPRNHERYGVLEAVPSDVRPSAQEEIRIGLQLREFDAVMRLEAMPKIAAAIAHQLHFGLVFLVARDEFAPIVLQPQSLHEEIVGVRPVVRQLGSLRDPPSQGFGDHVPRRRAELLGVKPAEAASAAVEGDFEVGVFGYFARVGIPNPVDAAARHRRGKAHLVDPNVPGKRRFRRPFLAGVQASAPPELSGFLIDSENPGNHPIRAVQHNQRYRFLYRRHRHFRRGQGGSARVAGLPAANGADVGLDAVFPFPVAPQLGGAFRAPRIPFRRPGLQAFGESGGLPLPFLHFLGDDFREGLKLLVGQPRDVFSCRGNSFRAWGPTGEELIAKQVFRSASKPNLFGWPEL